MEEVDSTYGIDPAACDNHAITNAVSNGHLSAVKYVIEEVDPKYGIHPAAQANMAIREASSNGHLDRVN